MSKTEQPSKSKTGRLIVKGSLSILSAYGLFVVLGGILQGLYGKPPAIDDAPDRTQQKWCVRQIAGLLEEMEGRVSHVGRLASEGGEAGQFERFYSSWRNRFTVAQSRCSATSDDIGSSYRALEQIQAGYVKAIRQILTTRSEAEEGLHQTIDRLVSHLRPNEN